MLDNAFSCLLLAYFRASSNTCLLCVYSRFAQHSCDNIISDYLHVAHDMQTVQRCIMRLYNLCCRPLGVCGSESTAHLERKEYKCVNLLIDERVNYRHDAIFVSFFEIGFQEAQMLKNS